MPSTSGCSVKAIFSLCIRHTIEKTSSDLLVLTAAHQLSHNPTKAQHDSSTVLPVAVIIYPRNLDS